LLDEPGLTLHGKAQADLLRYIEQRLLPDHQVIYSTHSPFMFRLHGSVTYALWKTSSSPARTDARM
jgi:predicted ATPase